MRKFAKIENYICENACCFVVANYNDNPTYIIEIDNWGFDSVENAINQKYRYDVGIWKIKKVKKWKIG